MISLPLEQMGTWILDAAKAWPNCEFVRMFCHSPGLY
jgi:hypothetical protein